MFYARGGGGSPNTKVVGVPEGNFPETLKDTCQFFVNYLLTPKRYQNLKLLKIPCFESTFHTQKRGKITKNKVGEFENLVCMTKSNKFEYLEIKLLTFSYLSIKS